ncbi:MAG: undecaprenyl diphosphate synthase family protein, partial [Ignavibacteriota bacterium]
VRIRIVGDRSQVSEKLRQAWEQAESSTQHNTRITLSVAFNYGGRWDIVQACRQAIADGVPPENLDESALNDTIRGGIYFPIPLHSVVINEIMPTPVSSSSQWVELYNQSASIIHLDSTIIEVGGIDTSYKFHLRAIAILPKHYALAVASTKLFSEFPTLERASGIMVFSKSSLSLTENGTAVSLLNKDGSTIDSLSYASTWHSPNLRSHTGISLERKRASSSSTDADNWISSLDVRGSTPLEKNSYSDDSIIAVSAVDVRISPNPFSPDGDGFHDETTITIAIPSDHEESISAKLYDLRGRLRRVIFSQRRVYRTESLFFDGKDDNGLLLPLGLYTLVVESESSSFPPQRRGLVIMKKTRQ